MESDHKPNGADGVGPWQGKFALIGAFIVAGPPVLIALAGLWLVVGQVEFREARFDLVKPAMTEAQVWLRMGPPEHVYTRVLLGPAIADHAGPYEADYVTPFDQPTVHALASVGWQYYQVGVVFNEDGRVIAKWGKFYFD